MKIHYLSQTGHTVFWGPPWEGLQPRRQRDLPLSPRREKREREAVRPESASLVPWAALCSAAERPDLFSFLPASCPVALSQTQPPIALLPRSEHQEGCWWGVGASAQCWSRPPCRPSACLGPLLNGPAFSPLRCHDSAAPGGLRQERGGRPGVDEGCAGAAADQRQHPGAPRGLGGEAAGDRGMQRPGRGPPGCSSPLGLRFPSC